MDYSLCRRFKIAEAEEVEAEKGGLLCGFQGEAETGSG